VAERRVLEDASAVADADDVTTQLGGLASLMFVTKRDHPAHARAQALDRHLIPVRARARMALATGSPKARAKGLEDCWRLVDKAGETLDEENWFHTLTTRQWAEQHIDHIRRARRGWKRPDSA
jgi:hypothetical protein